VRKHELRQSLAGLQDRAKSAQRAAAAERTKEIVAIANQMADSAAASLVEVIVHTIDAGSDRAALQGAVDAVQARCPRSAVMLFSPDKAEGKVSILASAPDVLIKRGLNASDWVRAAAQPLGGKGGGKPNSAQGGGTDLSKLKQALDAAETFA